MIRLLILLSLSACGTEEKEKDTLNLKLNAIREKQVTYLELIKDHQGEFGWFDGRDCDSLLFNTLLGYSGVPIDLLQARDGTGRWYRTPYRDCYATGRSGSTVSRDMLVGVMWQQNQTELTRLWDYGKKRNWKMGDGSADRVMFTTTMIKTLAKLIGKDHRFYPDVWIDPGKDHQRHVVALNALLRAKRFGKLDKKAVNLVNSFADKDENNALFAYHKAVFGNGSADKVISILTDERLFPRDRLPDSHDRCSRWLWERDHGYEPCKELPRRIHSGGDFLFLAKLLLD